MSEPKKGRPAGKAGPTKSQIDLISQAVEEGNYFETACELAGVSSRTAYEWIQRGEGRSKNRPGFENYTAFADGIRAANARSEAFGLKMGLQAGRGDWKFWMTFLARRFPDRWGANTAQSIAKMLEKMSDETLDAHLGTLITGKGKADTGPEALEDTDFSG